jgi:hypothetical protein
MVSGTRELAFGTERKLKYALDKLNDFAMKI